jgi:serine phosphatase RsbU (regulator of sigma subunit)
MAVLFVLATLPLQVQNQFPWYVKFVTALPVYIVVPGVLFLAGLISAEVKERKFVEVELQTARDMQTGLMPTADPIIEGYDISGLSKPSEEVGGDYFDYLWMNEEKTKLGIAIADVSGKAMKAAITAVMTSGMIYREIGNNQSPKEILKKINTPMFLKTQKNTFTAMSIAVINTKAKTLTLSNAGQTHPILKRGEETRFLKVEGTHYPLGIIEEVEYQELTVPMQSGDLIVFYTDGIAEATNANKELFGFDRLEQKIKQLTNETAKEVIQAIVGEAEKFAGSAKQHDDMTVVCVRVV